MKSLEPSSNRVHVLREWSESRQGEQPLGCNHPLLALSAEDIVRAWGDDTSFIWVHRPLEDSIEELRELRWFENPERVQRRIYAALDRFMTRARGVIIDYDDLQRDPSRTTRRLIDFTGLAPSARRVSIAESFARGDSHELAVPDKAPPTAPGAASVGYSSLDRPSLVATVLATDCEEAIGDALQSIIDWVDRVLLLDTGISDRTLDVARGVAGEKLVCRQCEWQNDFSAARNAALRFALDEQAEWAVTLDTDERLVVGERFSNQRALLDALNQKEVSVWLASSADGMYCKERFLRVSTPLEWRGRVHERLRAAPTAVQALLPGVVFIEEPKSPEMMGSKLRRDLRLLREDLAVGPDDSRNWYYLGQTLACLDQHEGAVSAFERCIALRGDDELAAWACFMASKSLAELRLYRDAIEKCSLGLGIDAYFPELAWMCGWCHFQCGDMRQAVAWSKMSISLGCVDGIGQKIERVGFRDLVGWYDGPFDVLRYALAQLGDQGASQVAASQYRQAVENRAEFVQGLINP